MTKRIIVKVIDGKENTVDESHVVYLTAEKSPDKQESIVFYTVNGIQYAGFWSRDGGLVEIPVSQILSID